MKKITVRKGIIERYESLKADMIIVKGHLIVEGTLQAKNIYGSGSLEAKKIVAQTVKADVINADAIYAKSAIANKIFCFSIAAPEGIIAKDYIEAHTVKTSRLIYSMGTVDNTIANEIIQMPSRKRGFLRAIFYSWVQEKFAGWRHNRISKSKSSVKAVADDKKDTTTKEVEAILKEYKSKLADGSYRLVLEPTPASEEPKGIKGIVS